MIAKLGDDHAWMRRSESWCGPNFSWVPMDDLKTVHDTVRPHANVLTNAGTLCRSLIGEKRRRLRRLTDFASSVTAPLLRVQFGQFHGITAWPTGGRPATAAIP